MNTFDKIVEQILNENKDRCRRRADQAYGKKNSLYKGGAIKKCRLGKIWKKK